MRLQRHLAERLETSSLAPFREQARFELNRNKRREKSVGATCCRLRLWLTAPLVVFCSRVDPYGLLVSHLRIFVVMRVAGAGPAPVVVSS